jgi:hypothetical protein
MATGKVRVSATISSSKCSGQSNPLPESERFKKSSLIEPQNEFPISEVVHESRELTESRRVHQSNEFPLSAIPDVSGFRELSHVIGFSERVHQSGKFTQSALFGSNRMSGDANKSQKLSGGALIGTIVGVLALVIVIICSIILWLRKRPDHEIDQTLDFIPNVINDTDDGLFFESFETVIAYPYE